VDLGHGFFLRTWLIGPERELEVHLPGELVLGSQIEPRIGLPLRQDFCQVDIGLANEVSFPEVIGVTCQLHDFSAFDPLGQRCRVLGRWWGRSAALGGRSDIVGVLDQREPYFLVPLRMLPASLDRLGSASLAIEGEDTVRVLLSDVPFVRKVVSFEDDGDESSNFSRSRGHEW